MSHAAALLALCLFALFACGAAAIVAAFVLLDRRRSEHAALVVLTDTLLRRIQALESALSETARRNAAADESAPSMVTAPAAAAPAEPLPAPAEPLRAPAEPLRATAQPQPLAPEPAAPHAELPQPPSTAAADDTSAAARVTAAEPASAPASAAASAPVAEPARAPAAAPARPPAHAAQTSVPSHAAAPAAADPAPPPESVEPAPPPPPPVPARATDAAGEPATLSFEARVGGRWFHYVGVVALLFGAAYFLQYAYQRGWYTPALQIASGLATGVAALVWGHRLARRGRDVLASGACGGGIALLHLVLFVGVRVHDIVPRDVAFVGMVATTCVGALLAVLHRSTPTAALAAVGAYATPPLLGAAWDAPGFLFVYIWIASAGFLAVGLLRATPWLRVLVSVATLSHLGSWWAVHAAEHRGLAALTASAFLVLTCGEALVAVLRQRGAAGAQLVALGAALLHAPALHEALAHGLLDWRGAAFLATSLAFLAGAALLVRRGAADDALFALFAGAAACHALLFPLVESRIEGWHVTLTWAVVAVLIQTLATRAPSTIARGWALVALLLAGARLLAFDAPGELLDPLHYTPLVSARGAAFLGVGAATAAVLRLRRRDPAAADAERLPVTFVWLLALALPVVFASLEVRSAFTRWVEPLFVGRAAEYAQARALWFDLMWVAYAGALAIVGRRRASRLVQVTGAMFGALILLRLIVVEIAVGNLPVTFVLLNARAAALLGSAAVLALVARDHRPGTASERSASEACRVLAHVLLLGALALEWHDVIAPRDLPGLLAGTTWRGIAALAAVHGTWLFVAARRRADTTASVLGATFALTAALLGCVLDPLVLPAHASVALVAPRTLLALLPIVAAHLLARLTPRDGTENRDVCAVATWLAHVATLVLLALEARDLFARHPLWNADAWPSCVAATPASIAALWALYAIAASRRAAARTNATLAGIGSAALAASGVAIAVALTDAEAARSVLANTRFAGGLMTAVALFVQGARARQGKRSQSAAVCALLGHALLITLLTREVADHFAIAQRSTLRGWFATDDARALAYSTLWALYGIAAVVAGFVRGERAVRLFALALLAGTVAKVFLFDLSFLDTPYRMLALVVLGAVLVGVSVLYQRRARRDAAEEPETQ